MLLQFSATVSAILTISVYWMVIVIDALSSSNLSVRLHSITVPYNQYRTCKPKPCGTFWPQFCTQGQADPNCLISRALQVIMCHLIIPIKVNFKTVLSFFHYLDHLCFKLQNSNSAYSLLIAQSALHTCMAYLSRWLYSGFFVLFLSYCMLVLKDMFSPTAELTNMWMTSGYLDKDIYQT